MSSDKAFGEVLAGPERRRRWSDAQNRDAALPVARRTKTWAPDDACATVHMREIAMFRLTVLLFLTLAWSGTAVARCPPPRDDEVIAQGGAIVTGRVAETGVDADRRTWARLQVTGRHAGQAPDSVRLLAADAGLYTPRFRAGEVVTFIIRAPFDTSTVSLCESRAP